MLVTFLSLLLLSLSIFASGAEDVASSWYWHQKYIGKVKHAVFHSFILGRKQVIVATEQNVLASLNLHTGDIYWRQLLGADDTINCLDTAAGKYVITLSGGNTLRSWSITDGSLFWETHIPTLLSRPTLDVTPIEIHHLNAKMILIFGDAMLYGVSSADGDILWETNTLNASQGGLFSLKRVLTGEDKNSLYGVGFTRNIGFSVWKICLFTGRLVMQEAATVAETICTDELIVTMHTVIALDCAGQMIFTGHIGPTKGFSISKTPIRDVVRDATGKARLLKATLEGVFLLQFVDQIVFIRIEPSGHDLQVLEMFERPAIVSNAVVLPFNRTAMMVVQHVRSIQENRIAARVVFKDGEKGETLSYILELDKGRGMVRRVHLSGYLRTDKSCGFRALLIMEDNSLLLIQKHDILWTREDGLATLQGSMAVDLPKELHKPNVQNLQQWLKAFFQRFMLLSRKRWSQNVASKKQSMTGITFSQDKFQFQKLLVVLTKPGKIVAMHTANGQIIWSLFMPSLKKSSEESKFTPVKILQWRPPAFVKCNNPVVLVIGKYTTGIYVGFLTWVDAYTGTELYSYNIPHVEDPSLFMMKDYEDGVLQLLVDAKRNVNIYSWSQKFLEICKQKGLNICFPVIDVETGTVTGYCMPRLTMVDTNTEMPLLKYSKLSGVWKIDFFKSSEKILCSSFRKHAEIMSGVSSKDELFEHSMGKTMMLATVSNVTKSESIQLTVYVIDVESGAILHQIKHANVQGPVHLINDGHWYVYRFFDMVENQHKISVGIIGKSSMGSEDIDDVIRRPCFGAVQSMYLGISENALSVTTLTLVKGLSDNTKRLLIGTTDGQIISMDITVAYRQNKRTRDGKLTVRLMKPKLPQVELTKVEPIKGLQVIMPIPTAIASRSLILAYGIDMLFTHVIQSERRIHLHVNHNVVMLLVITIITVLVSRVLLYHRKSQKADRYHADTVSQEYLPLQGVIM